MKILNNNLPVLLATLTGLSFIGLSALQSSEVIGQGVNQATVYNPPSNVRVTPNGRVLCSLRTVTTINVYGMSGQWYQTDACNGQMGYIHQSQVQLIDDNNTETVSGTCEVVGIRTGQLSLRFTPNGRVRAGLNNGNLVQPLQPPQGQWYYVKVLRGPNSRVTGLNGWVNSNYLNCYD